MEPVRTTIVAHIHHPEPGSTAVQRLRDNLCVLDLTGLQVDSPDLSVFFTDWEAARRWLFSLFGQVNRIDHAERLEREATAELAVRVAEEIAAVPS